jgi:hypothetical protein
MSLTAHSDMRQQKPKGTYKCKEIVVTIFIVSLKVYPQAKMLLRIKICKWNRFQEHFSLSLWHQAKLLFLAKLRLGNIIVAQGANAFHHQVKRW